MKKSLYFALSFCFVLILASCEKEQDFTSQQPAEKTRVFFNSTKDFYNTYQALSEMDCDEQIEWINSRGIKEPLYDSIENCTDEVMLDMPRAFQALFNKQLEVEINDSVIYFTQGKMYIKSINKTTLSTPILYGEVVINKDLIATTRNEYYNPYGKIGTSYLCEINLASGWRHQYVHELKSVVVNIANPNNGINQKSNLYLVIKFEYKKNKGWREATAEQRNIYINLNICKRNFLQVNRTQEILIESKTMPISTSPGVKYGHYINISGTIRHEVIGRTDSRRENRWGQPTVVTQYWYTY